MATPVGSTVYNGNKMVSVTWALGNADTGVATSINRWADRTVHVLGTFGGATVTVEGSNDGVNFLTLSDTTGAALMFTAAGMKVILENPIYIRAKTAGGTGSAVTVIVAGAGGQ